MDDNLRTITLHGALANQFGDSFDLAVDSPAEAVRAMAQIDGFHDAISIGSYRVIVRDKDQGIDDMRLCFGSAKHMDIIPVAEGAKRGGIGKIILGVLLIVVSFYVPPAGATLFGGTISAGQVALLGTTVLLGGVVQFITPQPGLGDLDRGSGDQRPGFLFNGVQTGIEQGGPVPLIFGRVRVGGQVVSSGLTAERTANYDLEKLREEFSGFAGGLNLP